MGWRFLYLVGLIPLSIVAWLRRSLPETQEFEDRENTGPAESTLSAVFRPILNLARMYPGRLLAVGAVIFFLPNFAENAAGFFGPKYLQEVHGWLPWHYSMISHRSSTKVVGLFERECGLTDHPAIHQVPEGLASLFKGVDRRGNGRQSPALHPVCQILEERGIRLAVARTPASPIHTDHLALFQENQVPPDPRDFASREADDQVAATRRHSP